MPARSYNQNLELLFVGWKAGVCFVSPLSVSAAAVRDAVVDAIDELYLANCDAEQAAHNLVGLAQGSSLGAHDIFQIVRHFVQMRSRRAP